MSEEGANGEVEALHGELRRDSEAGGYIINTDLDMTLPLVEGLLLNMSRYGYPLCPCRLSGGSRDADLDIICPCDYRDEDLAEFGACY